MSLVSRRAPAGTVDLTFGDGNLSPKDLVEMLTRSARGDEAYTQASYTLGGEPLVKRRLCVLRMLKRR